ncbi:MAG: hypothetical protein NT069_24255 [Planctomycetota bacterium]|nr:hypothetical protein [Planctomycetota bacterium]
MRWTIGVPVGYLGVCGFFLLQSQFRGGPASVRWLPVQGLTIPWGVALSYLPVHDEWSELALAGCYLSAMLLNAGLLALSLRWVGKLIARLERLDETKPPGGSET